MQSLNTRRGEISSIVKSIFHSVGAFNGSEGLDIVIELLMLLYKFHMSDYNDM
jgi:hypothetical protein